MTDNPQDRDMIAPGEAAPGNVRDRDRQNYVDDLRFQERVDAEVRRREDKRNSVRWKKINRWTMILAAAGTIIAAIAQVIALFLR